MGFINGDQAVLGRQTQLADETCSGILIIIRIFVCFQSD